MRARWRSGTVVVRAAELNPDDWSAAFGLGTAFYQQGDSVRALALVEDRKAAGPAQLYRSEANLDGRAPGAVLSDDRSGLAKGAATARRLRAADLSRSHILQLCSRCPAGFRWRLRLLKRSQVFVECSNRFVAHQYLESVAILQGSVSTRNDRLGLPDNAHDKRVWWQLQLRNRASDEHVAGLTGTSTMRVPRKSLGRIGR